MVDRLKLKCVIVRLMTDGEHQVICSIEHPFFDVISNSTRRQVMRLIACEHNYGNRIANILNLSTPAIHRHLKFLEGNESNPLPIIRSSMKTKESYSGKKGGEATLYEMSATLGLFYIVMPNYVHSHILGPSGQEGMEEEIPENLKSLKAKLPTGAEGENLAKRISYYNLTQSVAESNRRILELEMALMDEMKKKDQLMKEVDDILMGEPDLEYNDRVILRAITCLGEKCSSNLTHLMNLNYSLLSDYVSSLRARNWVE